MTASSERRLILGSGSPRRLELLAQIGVIPHEIRAPDIDETPRGGELPRDYCRRMAMEKAEALVPAAGEVILTADTTVALGRRILGKPADAESARQYLARLSGRRHRVMTAVVLRSQGAVRRRDTVSSVRLKMLSRSEIDGYIATGDWQGKAGGYAIQGPAAAFAQWIQGSHSAIVGLPLYETAQLLASAGISVWNQP